VTALWIICGILAVILVFGLVRFLGVKKDIRQLGKRLDEIIRTDTNAQLTTQTFDKDIVSLAKSANDLLAKSRQDFFKAQRTEADLKRAISNISHDLRTPLTSAKGYLQMLAGADEEAVSRYLGIIKGRLDTLTALMDNLFTFSRAMDENIFVKKVNVGNVLKDAITDSYVELTRKGFTVESNITSSPVYWNCDEDALKRIFQNLVKNAYIHGNSYIRVTLKDNKIEIANKAAGLNEIDIARIFDRFYTADAARTHKRTGLGLAIAKELTQRMGGQISANKEGDMLVVVITLPE